MVEGSLEVETGDLVTRGQPLGILGGTPNYEPHIHIGFFYDYNGSSNVSMLNVLLMEGLKLDEYVNSCWYDDNGAHPNRYFLSTQ
jgi:murein DD-endopeptidase MepM/ murein hydrolase activator NlpD